MESLRQAAAFTLLAAAAALAAPPSRAAEAPAPAAHAGWIARSNANADYAVGVLARFQPEGAGQLGVTSVDKEIRDLTPGYRERAREASEQAIGELEKRTSAEKDPLVRQDLEIMIEGFRDNL